MASTRKIIGIALLRNEEYFSLWSLGNAVDFCDEFIVLDNRSDDRTGRNVERFAELHPKVRLERIDNPNTSHRFVQGYAGEDAWLFGVDGDEIYHPGGLRRLRSRILEGEFDAYWTLSGYLLHAVRVDLEERRAAGYLTPPAPRGSKLFNFGALVSWIEPNRERLHGHNEVFRPGYSRRDNLDLFESEPWDESDLRAIHLCFYPRSRLDPEEPVTRRNPSERHHVPFRRVQNAVKNFAAAPFSRRAGYKGRKYRKGPVVEVDITGFGRPGEWREHDPEAAEAEQVLAVPRE